MTEEGRGTPYEQAPNGASEVTKDANREEDLIRQYIV